MLTKEAGDCSGEKNKRRENNREAKCDTKFRDPLKVLPRTLISYRKLVQKRTAQGMIQEKRITYVKKKKKAEHATTDFTS